VKLENIEPLSCTGCGACEIACSFYRDKVFTPIRSSIMLHREEKKNYFGIMVKVKDDSILGKPERVVYSSQDKQEVADGAGGGAKPILMRPECNDCDGQMFCVRFCPAASIRR